jgi:hypothetical protein
VLVLVVLVVIVALLVVLLRRNAARPAATPRTPASVDPLATVDDRGDLRTPGPATWSTTSASPTSSAARCG